MDIMFEHTALTQRKDLPKAALLLTLLLLQACGGRYQAPLEDQSAVLTRTPPPIYSTTGPSSVGGIAASAQVTSPSTSAPSNAGARTIAAGVPVTPAAGVSVNVANDSGGIQRSGIGRTPLGDSPLPTAASSTSADTVAVSSPPVTGATGTQTHTVVRGETLYSIAWGYSVDYRALALANNLSEPYTIYPDQQLNINITGVSSNALQAVPAIPAAPAGNPAIVPGERPAAAVANRRTGNVQSREVDNIIWQWPVEGRVVRSYNASASTTNRGIDIGARRGDGVYAAADGDVVYSGSGIQGQGDLVIIRHSARHLSAYSHNTNLLVSEGASIRAGDKIAEVGTDPRGADILHFEVRVDGVAVDPARYLPQR